MTDYRPERTEYGKVHKNWQETLESKGIEGKAVGEQASRNYKTHVGKTARELNEELEWKTPILDTFSTEQLERHTRLEEKQIEKVEPVNSRDRAIKECKEVRDNKSWWW